MTQLSTLPLDILVEIFDFLPAGDRRSLYQTNGHLREVLSPTYWKKIVVSSSSLHSPYSSFPFIPASIFFHIDRHSWIPTEYVKFIVFDEISDGFLRNIFPHSVFRSLEAIELKTVSFTPALRKELNSPFYSTIFELPRTICGTHSLYASADMLIPFAEFSPTLAHMLSRLELDLDNETPADGLLALGDFPNIFELRLDIKGGKQLPTIVSKLTQWSSLQSLEVQLKIAAKQEPMGTDSYWVEKSIQSLKSLPQLDVCKLEFTVVYFPSLDITDSMVPLRPITLPQITHLAVSDREDLEGYVLVESLLSCPTAVMRRLTVWFDYERRKAANLSSVVLSENLDMITLEISTSARFLRPVIPYLPDLPNVRRVVIVSDSTVELGSSGGYLEAILAEVFGHVRSYYLASPVLPETVILSIIENIVRRYHVGSSMNQMVLSGYLRDLLFDPLENLSTFANVSLPGSPNDVSLRKIAILESIFLQMREMPRLEYFQLELQDDFYISPNLQHLSVYHPTLKQILVSILGSTLRFASKEDSDGVALVKRLYRVLPDVPYKQVSNLKVLVGKSYFFSGEGGDNDRGTTLGPTVLVESSVSAVIDVQRKRTFEEGLFSITCRSGSSGRTLDDVSFDTNDIYEEPFDGWI